MGQISLPPELQTKKVKSLSGDARKLVEDLLAEKFDIKEEVVREKSRDPFPFGTGPRGVSGAFGPNGFGAFGVEFDSHVERRRESSPTIEVFLDFQTGQRMARSFIRRRGSAEGSVADAMMVLDDKNLPNRNRIIRVHSDTMRKLHQEIGHSICYSQNSRLMQLWGADIEVVGPQYQQTIEQRI